jgi:hypothetical protein
MQPEKIRYRKDLFTHPKPTRESKRVYANAQQEILVMDALVNGPRTIHQIKQATGLSRWQAQATLRRLQGFVRKNWNTGKWSLIDN